MRIVCRRRWLLSVALALALAGLVTARPARPAGADSETFFNTGATTPAPCPIAHCDQQLDGRENLSIAASTPPLTSAIALYTPSPAAAFNNGLGCTTGEDAAATDPDLVTCALSNTAGNTSGPFLYSITATGSLSSTALSLNWASAPYTGTQPTTCTTGSSGPWTTTWSSAPRSPTMWATPTSATTTRWPSTRPTVRAGWVPVPGAWPTPPPPP